MTELLLDGARGDESDLAFALDLAGIADSVAMRHFTGAPIHAEVKADGSPVSDADYEIETRLRAAVCEVFPATAISGRKLAATPRPKSGGGSSTESTVPSGSSPANQHGAP